MQVRPITICIAAIAAVGAWLLCSGLYIHAKAWLAQQLIASAWSRTLEGQAHVKPWPWADTWPVARLRVPALDVDEYVLADASGRSLAFGPGHVDGTAALGADGDSMIAGHRDTHFRFLQRLQPGSLIVVQTSDGREHTYRLSETHTFDIRRERLVLPQHVATLTLLTCFPFEALVPGGPLRYAAIAQREVPGTSD